MLFFDSALHRVHAVSFDAAVLDVASMIVAAGYIVSVGICDAAEMFVSADGIKWFLLAVQVVFLLVIL
ncbi:hypothetical protein Tco_1137836 [Tanacetum coccineum]